MSAHPPELRLLPWTTPEGRPCYVPTDTGWLSAYADAIEGQQPIWGHDVLERSAYVLQGGASETELRFPVQRLSEALRGALRIAAESRTGRIAEPGGDGPPGVGGPSAEAFG